MKKLAIAILTTTLVIASVTIGVCLYANSPKTVVRNSFENMFDDFWERDDIEPIVNIFTQGSVSVNVTSNVDENGKIEFGGKAYFSENELYLENLYAKSGDIKLDADVYLGKDYAYLTNDKILGGTYGIATDDIIGNLKKSMFAPGSNSEFSLDEKTFNELVRLLEQYTNKNLKNMPEDVEEIYDHYSDFILDSIEKHADYESDKDEVSVGGEYVYSRIITVTIDQKDILNVIKDLYEELKDDDDIRDVLAEYSDYFESVVGNFDPNGKAQNIDIVEYYDKALNSMESTIDSMEENISKFKIYVKLVTPATSSKVLKFTVSVREEGQKRDIISVDFGRNGIKKSDCITIESNGIKAKYEISEHSSKKYSSSFKIYNGEKWISVCNLTIDKKEDYFRITTPEMFGNITIRGTFEQKGDKTTLGLNKIKIGEQTIDGFNITVVLEENDSAPKPISKDEIKDIITINETDIEKIASNVEEFFSEIGISPDMFEEIFKDLDNIGGIGGSAYPDDDDWDDWGDDWGDWDDDYYGDEGWG